MSSAGERAVNGKRELTEGLAAQILEHIRGGGLATGTHLTAQNLAERFSVSRFPVSQAGGWIIFGRWAPTVIEEL